MKYYVLIAILVLSLLNLGEGSTIVGPAWGCADEGECHNGQCRAQCGVLPLQWCYTTKSGNSGGPVAKCGKNSDCGACWKCHSPCSWQ